MKKWTVSTNVFFLPFTLNSKKDNCGRVGFDIIPTQNGDVNNAQTVNLVSTFKNGRLLLICERRKVEIKGFETQEVRFYQKFIGKFCRSSA